MDLNDKKVLVVGMGKSGIAAMEALLHSGARVSIYDKKQEKEMDPGFIEHYIKKNIKGFFGRNPDNIKDYDLIIVSPGVSTDLSFLKQAKNFGIEMIGEVELAYRLSNSKYIAITGTNGKTTTTMLTGEILKNAGRETQVVGNVGLAAVSMINNANQDTWMVTEISSFQLETIVDFHPRISALLNITPDHLDRHLTMENYIEAKAKIFMNQRTEDYFIFNYDDSFCFELAKKCQAKIVPFSRNKELSFGAFIKNGNIVVCDHHGSTYNICGAKELKIPGSHNLENALAATTIAFFAGIAPESIGNTLRRFQSVEHRLELCGEINGIKFVNDSKGTNINASIKAIDAIDSDIILIAGGYDKGADFGELIEACKGKVLTLVLLGKTAPAIKAAAEAKGFTDIILAKNMEQCVNDGYRAAKPGNTVLLSPACASWDMYANYEQRGEHFKSCVKNLRKRLKGELNGTE